MPAARQFIAMCICVRHSSRWTGCSSYWLVECASGRLRWWPSKQRGDSSRRHVRKPCQSCKQLWWHYPPFLLPRGSKQDRALSCYCCCGERHPWEMQKSLVAYFCAAQE